MSQLFIELLFGVFRNQPSFCDILRVTRLCVCETSFWNCSKLDFSLSLSCLTDVGYKSVSFEWLAYSLRLFWLQIIEVKLEFTKGNFVLKKESLRGVSTRNPAWFQGCFGIQSESPQLCCLYRLLLPILCSIFLVLIRSALWQSKAFPKSPRFTCIISISYMNKWSTD